MILVQPITPARIGAPTTEQMISGGAIDTKVAAILTAQHSQTLHHAIGGAGAAPQSDIHPAPALASEAAYRAAADPLTVITAIKQADKNRGDTRAGRNGGGGALIGEPVYTEPTITARMPDGLGVAPSTNQPSLPPHRDSKGSFVTIPRANINNQMLPVT